jgi:D-serine deaminase-like pyridoxal phosphate-dependent protein
MLRAEGDAMDIEALDTPAVVIDLDRVDANLAAAQRYADEHGLALRPHVKTHKLPALAHRQVALGAVGITAQKIGEAAVMVAAGIEDVLLSYPLVGDTKLEPLARLARATPRLAVALDNAVSLDLVGRAAAEAERTIDVLIEFESGRARTGVIEPDEALALARAIEAHPRLRLRGFMTYPLGPGAGDWVHAARALLARDGLEAPVFSGGGTPRMLHAHETAGLTEMRPGTYVYHDRATVAAGAGRLDDCALHVHVTVVSTPERGRAVIDAGSKTLTSDLVAPDVGDGYGLVLEHPEAVITALSEEHGVLDVSRCERPPRVGDRVRIVPNHVCPVSNLHDLVYVHRGGAVHGAWPVAARGTTR